MKSGNKYDEVLLRYWLDECNEEEENFIINWLSDDEANKLYFENLVDFQKLVEIKEVINKIDIDQEWQHCQQFKKGNQQKVFQLAGFINRDEEILLGEHPVGKTRIFRLILSGAIVASFVVAVFLAFGYFSSNTSRTSSTARNKGNVGTSKNDPLMVVMLQEENTTDKIKRFSLPDGSEIELFSNSELTYLQPPQKSRREVVLKGKAKFKVAKDKTSPFTVFSGDISTTALGTQFTVRAIPQEKEIFVRLYEGKVIIKGNKATGNNKMKEVYLMPGQEMVYDIIKGTSSVQIFTVRSKQSKKEISKDEKIMENTIIPSFGKKSWFMFNKQPLSEIFDALSEMYSVKINYSKNDINKMYFISMFDKSDSIENILKEIASINNLIVVKDSTTNTYTVEKQVPKEAN